MGGKNPLMRNFHPEKSVFHLFPTHMNSNPCLIRKIGLSSFSPFPASHGSTFGKALEAFPVFIAASAPIRLDLEFPWELPKAAQLTAQGKAILSAPQFQILGQAVPGASFPQSALNSSPKCWEQEEIYFQISSTQPHPVHPAPTNWIWDVLNAHFLSWLQLHNFGAQKLLSSACTVSYSCCFLQGCSTVEL